LKSSHKDSKVNDQFDEWLQDNYGEHGEVVIHHGKQHDCLDMELDFSKKRKGQDRYDLLEAPRMDPRSRPAEPQDYTQNRCSQE
jgi:hypothetical protein